MIKMANKYGIYQSTSKSCTFYKQDEDGNQSTFNIFIAHSKQELDKKEVFAFIDNEQMKKDNLAFELEAHKSMSHCLVSVLKKEENE